MDDIAIKVEHVSKTFKLPHEKQTSIKGALISRLRGGARTYERQRVLDDVCFEVKKGEFFGIVGRNGSGKSTMLKMLAGIYVPTSGGIHVNGKLTPFIELGVGFNPELTGRENIFLNGALLGFNRAEMNALYDDIVAFAELEKFMDQKLKNYSSGMQVRLAFSIAIRAKSDILLLDEVLAVGDAAFQRKCFDYFGELKKNKQTVVFISHDMGSVRKYCDRAIMIDKGVIKARGSTEEVVDAYSKLFLELDDANASTDAQQEVPLGMAPQITIDSHKVSIGQVRVVDQKGSSVKVVDRTDSTLRVSFVVEAKADVREFVPGVIVQNTLGEFITATNSKWASEAKKKSLKKGESTTVTFLIPNVYEKGDYKISVNVVSPGLDVFYAWQNNACRVYIDRLYETGAKTYPKFTVEYK